MGLRAFLAHADCSASSSLSLGSVLGVLLGMRALRLLAPAGFRADALTQPLWLGRWAPCAFDTPWQDLWSWPHQWWWARMNLGRAQAQPPATHLGVTQIVGSLLEWMSGSHPGPPVHETLCTQRN